MTELDRRLEEVSYKWEGYKPSINSLMFANFISLVNADRGGEENKTPIAHLHLMDSIFSKYKRHAVCATRGFAKTTLLGEYLILFLGTTGGEFPGFSKNINVAMYVANSMEKGGSDLVRNLDFRYKSSSFLQEEIPDWRATDGRVYMRNKDGKEFAMRIYGAKTGVRGFKEFGERPKLAIIDDILKDNELSQPFLKRIDDLINKGVANALHPRMSKTIFIGTPFLEKDPLVRKIGNKQWKSSVYPICEKFPCRKDEFRSVWEDRFDFNYVMDQYLTLKEDGKEDAFYQELMLKLGSDEQRLVEDKDIIFVEPPQGCNYVITTDFATSGKGDYSVLGVWALTKDKEHILVDGFCRKQTMDRNIQDLFRYASEYKVVNVGLEVSGAQQGFVSWIREQMLEKKVYFVINEVRPQKDKFSRFYDVYPMIKSGKIKFSKKLDKSFMVELKNELAMITKTGIKAEHDDVLDIISMLLNVEKIYPTYNVVYESNIDEFYDAREEEDEWYS